MVGTYPYRGSDAISATLRTRPIRHSLPTNSDPPLAEVCHRYLQLLRGQRGPKTVAQHRDNRPLEILEL